MESLDTIFVTGACGWIGRNVCQFLRAKGFRVVACDIVEQEGPWDSFLCIDISAGEIPLEAAQQQLTGDRQGVCLIHCAGYAHRPIETPEEVERFYAINHQGTVNVINWCKALEIQKIVYVSSIAFYDWGQEGALVEESELDGRTAYADSKLKGEQAILDSELDYRIVRLATVYGQGDRANFAKLAGALNAGRFIVPGGGNALKSVISVNYAAEFIARIGLRREVPHRLVNLGFSRAPTLAQVCDGFVKHCDCKPPKRLPIAILKLMALFGDVVAKVKPGFPLTSVNVGKLLRSTQVDCSKAVEIFPELNEITFEDELRVAADYYRSV